VKAGEGAGESNGARSGGSGGDGNATSVGGSGIEPGSGGSGVAAGAPGTSGASVGGAPSTGLCGGLRLAPAGDACVSAVADIVPVPRDLLFLFDRSDWFEQSVERDPASTFWDALRSVMEEFVVSADPSLRLGMGYLSRSGVDDDALDCDASWYAAPAVSIGELPGSGAELLRVLSELAPGGHSPLGPALAGTLKYAVDWASTNPDRATTVVVVSAGSATQCEPTLPTDIAGTVIDARNTAPVRTYVLNLSTGTYLDPIALAGGTGAGVRVDYNDFSFSLGSALADVARGCEYQMPELPTGRPFDPAKVNLVYTAPDGVSEVISVLAQGASCADSPSGGFYVDYVSTPQRVVLCPCTCAGVGPGQVQMLIGCSHGPVF
jgi:hypothetical protein